MFIAFVPMALAAQVLAAQVLVAQVLVAAPGGLPSIDIQKGCRESSDAVSGSTTGSIFDSCVEDETDASAQLAKGWASFPAADKARCVNPAIYLPSYVEWLTCIEGESTLRRIHNESGGAPPG
jgi:hypothetical protein